jgi:thiamine pyrophosphokinase
MWDNSILHLIHGPASVTITGKQGSNVGLIAAGGSASGITTTGLKWALSNESLAPHSSRGVSNQLVEETAVISLQEGSLFVVQSSALSS